MILPPGVPHNLQNLPGPPPFAVVFLPLQVGKKPAPSDEKNKGLPIFASYRLDCNTANPAVTIQEGLYRNVVEASEVNGLWQIWE